MTECTASRQKSAHTESGPLKVSFSVWMCGLAILMLGSALTLTTSSIMRDRSASLGMEAFNREADVATKQLENAIEKDEALIVAVQGMFHSFETVSREEFRRFVAAIDIARFFPNTQALSWNALVPVGQLTAFERSVQQDYSVLAGGYPDFRVRPAEADGQRYVVTYIEPMAGNEDAFGFDIGSNPVRRHTVELARDSNEALATAPITLAQETGEQKGILIIMPVYLTADPEDIASRRELFQGVVVAVFRIGDLVSGSGDLDFSTVRVMDVTVDADDTGKAPEVIYAKGQRLADTEYESLVRRVDVAGRQWEIVYSQTTDTLRDEGRLTRWAVPGLGALSTALAALLVVYLATSRQRTLLRAEALTIDLKQANEKLCRSNSDLSQFAHVASHDLQTPVRNIMGSVSMLEDAIGEEPSDEIQRYMQFLKDSTLRMKSLISDLLSYAESGQELDRQSVDLDTILSLVATATQDMFESQAASLQIAPLPTVSGDEQQLERVFTNLITNALKYARADVPLQVEIACRDTAQFHEIRIRDNGMGIAEEYQKSIFEPFKRLHRQNEIAGTGLGLAICRQIMDRHGGLIGVEESSEAGTTILLQFPLFRQSESREVHG